MGDKTKTIRRAGLILALGVGILTVSAQPAEAGGLIDGIQKIVAGVLEIPVSTIVGTFTGPPIIGTIFGVVSGTLQGAGLIAGGALDLAFAGADIAKFAAPYVLPFVL